MDNWKLTRPRFFQYPPAKEGPIIPYYKSEDANPVFTGTLLVVGAWIVSKVEFIQSYLWRNAGFNVLRDIKHLGNYTERYDPTVIPLRSTESIYERPKLDYESIQMYPDGKSFKYHTSSDYHAMYLSGQLTPLAVAESLLPLIRRNTKSPSHHSTAFISSNSEAILEAARASTLRYKSGTPLSIVDGVPTAVKDESNVAGYKTTFGRKVVHDTHFVIQEESSWPVRKLQEAGMVILGKLNMHELGADTTNNNPTYGTPLNPYNSSYYTGGSSGGAAYVISAGLVPFALGADGGGSIRIPSSFCGLYGLKPSHSRLEVTGSSVTCTGPLAACISDLEIAYRIMANPNPQDSVTSLFAPPQLASATRPKILGIYKEWFNRADPAVLKFCNQAVDHMTSNLGYKVVDITVPYVPEAQKAHTFTILSEMALRARASPSNPSNWLADLNPANKVLLAVGGQTPARDYLLAQQMRNLLMQHLSFLYRSYPGMIIVTPTTPMAGWPIASPSDLIHGITDGNTSVRNMEFVWLANFCGNPAISCPVGYADSAKGEGRIPIGLMGMGEWGSEDELLAWGRECEEWLNENTGREKPKNWEDVVGNARGLVV